MKNRNLLLIILLLSFSFLVKGQDKALSVEKQYPNDEKAYKIYENYEHTQLDSTATAIRTSWVANTPKDNWFMSVNAGFGQLMSEETRYMDFKDQVKPTFEFAFGKWFSPVWGLRLSITVAELQGFATWSEQGPKCPNSDCRLCG